MQHSKNIAATFLVIVALLALLLLFIVSTIFLYQKKHLSFINKLEEAKIKYESELLKSQLEVQEQTLDHISRELHDGIGAHFTLAKLYLNTIALASDPSPDNRLFLAIDLLTRGLEDLRDISKSISLDLIRSVGLSKAIEAQVSTLTKIGQHSIRFSVLGCCDYDNEQKEIIVFRIFQEAINNIICHAQAKEIVITLDGRKENHLLLVIEDDGKGFSADAAFNKDNTHQHRGLRNMRTRAGLINGDLVIRSLSGAGTIVSLSVTIFPDTYLNSLSDD